MADGLAAFDRPSETLGWAREAINDLNLTLTGFFNNQPFSTVIEPDPETGHEVHKIKLLTPIPNGVPRRATEALNNVKNAFDQTTFAACAAIGKRPKKDIHFPWRLNPTDLERVFDKKDAVIPPELRDVFRGHQPYPTGEGYSGGDDGIREVARIANLKHTVGLGITGRVPMMRWPDVSHASFVRAPMPRWDPVKNEMILLIVDAGAKVKHNHEVAFYVALNEPGPLEGEPILGALSAFLQKAEQVLIDLKLCCTALGAR